MIRHTKALLTAILAAIIAILPTAAQEAYTAKTFRVYRTDGRTTGFFYNEIDSITTTLDGNDLVQLFHTSDSVFAIPAAEIDSICFRPIPTVWQPGSIDLEGDISAYIIGSDSLTLFLSPSCPQNLIPRRGDNVATLNPLENLPYGFMGHVENIVERLDTIRVECSAPSLTDIFQSAAIEMTLTLPDTIIQPESRGIVEGNQEITISGVALEDQVYSVDLRKEMDAGGGLTGNYSLSGSMTKRTTVRRFNAACYVIPESFRLPHVTVRYTQAYDHELEFAVSFGASYKFEKKIPFGKFKERLPQFAGIIETFQEVGFYISFEGEAGLNGSITLPYTTYLHLELDSRNEGALPNIFRIIPRKPQASVGLECTSTIGVGFYGKMGIAPVAKDLANVETELSMGVDFSATESMLTWPTYVTANTSTYDDANRDDFFTGNLKIGLEMSFSVFNDKKLSIGREISGIFKNPMFQWGAVPEFSNVSLTSNGPNSLTATATAGRKILIPVMLGLGLYDANNKLVDSWWDTDSYLNEDKGLRTITHTFEGLQAQTQYTVHPIVQYTIYKFAANPSATAETDRNDNLSYEIQNLNNSYNVLQFFDSDHHFHDIKLYKGDYRIQLDIPAGEIILTDSLVAINPVNGYANMQSRRNAKISLASSASQVDGGHILLSNQRNSLFLNFAYEDIEFDEEDYNNWIARMDDEFYIHYYSSIDDFSTERWMKLDIEIIYDQKPKIIDWHFIYPTFPTDEGMAGDVYCEVEGNYWYDDIEYESTCESNPEIIVNPDLIPWRPYGSITDYYYDWYTTRTVYGQFIGIDGAMMISTGPENIKEKFHDIIRIKLKDGSELGFVDYTYTWRYEPDRTSPYWRVNCGYENFRINVTDQGPCQNDDEDEPDEEQKEKEPVVDDGWTVTKDFSYKIECEENAFVGTNSKARGVDGFYFGNFKIYFKIPHGQTMKIYFMTADTENGAFWGDFWDAVLLDYGNQSHGNFSSLSDVIGNLSAISTLRLGIRYRNPKFKVYDFDNWETSFNEKVEVIYYTSDDNFRQQKSAIINLPIIYNRKPKVKGWKGVFPAYPIKIIGDNKIEGDISFDIDGALWFDNVISNPKLTHEVTTTLSSRQFNELTIGEIEHIKSHTGLHFQDDLSNFQWAEDFLKLNYDLEQTNHIYPYNLHSTHFTKNDLPWYNIDAYFDERIIIDDKLELVLISGQIISSQTFKYTYRQTFESYDIYGSDEELIECVHWNNQGYEDVNFKTVNN